MKRLLMFFACLFIVRIGFAQEAGDTFKTEKGSLVVTPVLHGTLALQWDGKTIFVDPYGGKDVFGDLPTPDLILITDVHGDHFDANTLKELNTADAQIIAPQAVIDKMSENFKNKSDALSNGKRVNWGNIGVEALPMYNLPETVDSKHPKGRGNGYVLTIGGNRLYISGDTEDIPEMRKLKDIDIAFVCMNLPYTMSVEQAADAVLEFKPKVVYPYHYRGSEGLSDTEEFKTLVNKTNKSIEVRIRNWYPEN